MNVAIPVPDSLSADLRPSSPGRIGPYLRSFRAQPRRRPSPRVVLVLLLAIGLLFLRVWECSVANSLSMERDRLAREVRSLENHVRISRDLREQAAFMAGADMTSLDRAGFQTPDPAQIIDIDLSEPRSRVAITRNGLGSGIGAMLRRVLPARIAERVVGLPAVPVAAGLGQ
jgi:hypothetical protein